MLLEYNLVRKGHKVLVGIVCQYKDFKFKILNEGCNIKHFEYIDLNYTKLKLFFSLIYLKPQQTKKKLTIYFIRIRR